MSDLRECPFCGGEAEIAVATPPWPQDERFMPRCCDEECLGSMFGGYYLSHEQARVGWNTRTQAAADRETIERLTAERDEALAKWRETDTCMCGARMDDHDIGSGHTPVSMYDYEFDQVRQRAEAAEAQSAALAAQVEAATALIRRWVSWCDDWYAGKPHPSDDIDAARAYLAALSTTGETKEPAPLTPSERHRAAETVQVARAVHGTKEPCLPPHEWVASTLGHGDAQCKHCLITNREAAVLGRLNQCDARPDCNGGDHG